MPDLLSQIHNRIQIFHQSPETLNLVAWKLSICSISQKDFLKKLQKLWQMPEKHLLKQCMMQDSEYMTVGVKNKISILLQLVKEAVVGAGTAGSVLAARLSEDPRVQVLLLEAGDKETDRPETPFITTPGLAKQLRNSSVDWKYFTQPQENALFGYKNKQAALPRGKVIGGTFALNDMIYQRGSPGIFDEWDKKGAKGWGFKHVAPYFRKSVDTKVIELSKSDLHRSCGPMTVSTLQPTSLLNVYFNATQSLGYDAINCNEKEDQGICRIQTNIRGGERLTTAKAYLNEARGRQNLNIVTKALVSRVS
ncbi:unnamed protein product [Mytilus edulis]|uniref:Glucose-methanol-choline oxidoreductase N-terminal domain-containing protein n=1 Tax=Mytilus edulis TaxID=6550 RepID=A0A8S3UQ28_MYTED|nr:unnamed protein product [Mytilus edulis]